MHCGPPVQLPHTNYTMAGGDTVGGKVMYMCNHGYERLSGSGFSRCPLSGTWTKPSLVCEGELADLYTCSCHVVSGLCSCSVLSGV